MNEEMFDLLTLMGEANRIYYVNADTPQTTLRLLTKALCLGFVSARFEADTDVYELTAKGDEALAAYSITKPLEEAERVTYPAMFVNKEDDTLVLAIFETIGTVLYSDEAHSELAVGTFKTDFTPFTNKDVWRRIKTCYLEI